jgi:hypothetical protein
MLTNTQNEGANVIAATTVIYEVPEDTFIGYISKYVTFSGLAARSYWCQNVLLEACCMHRSLTYLQVLACIHLTRVGRLKGANDTAKPANSCKGGTVI